MGTDIHMRAEVKPAPDAPWLAVGSVFPNGWYDPIRDAQTKHRLLDEGRKTDSFTSIWSSPTTPEPYGNRNYTLFAALSDVRNGYGFAGIPTGEPIPSSVAAGRGLPADLARHFDEERYLERKQYDEWDAGVPEDLSNEELAERLFIFGAHSQGWLTLGELLDYDWDYEVTHYGLVKADEFRRCYESRFELEPRSWCGDISGGSVIKLDAEAAIAMIHAGQFPEAAEEDADPDDFSPRPTPSYHVRHEWSHPLREDVQDFLDTVDKMRSWGCDYKLWHKDGNGSRNPKATMHNPDHIRLVFGYDS
jgi:hypothetical protein